MQSKQRAKKSSVNKETKLACKAKKQAENPVYTSAEKDKNCEHIQLHRQTDPEFCSTERLKDSEKKKHKCQTDCEECAAEINCISWRLDLISLMFTLMLKNTDRICCCVLLKSSFMTQVKDLCMSAVLATKHTLYKMCKGSLDCDQVHINNYWKSV